MIVTTSTCRSCFLFLKMWPQKNLTCFCRQLCLSSRLTQVEKTLVKSSWTERDFKRAKLEEKDHHELGITQFIGSHPKVYAVIKKHSYDFQVHELDKNGNKVQLTDLSLPDPPELKEGQQQFLECTLYKETMGHAQVHSLIAKILRLKLFQIRFFGRKDKWAQTTQKMSIESDDPIPIEKLKLKSKKLTLGNFKYCSEPLNYENRRGNHFKILVKNIQLDTDDDGHMRRKIITDAMKSLSEIGFINYFGLQRFARSEVPLVGPAILQNDWERVFDLLLTPLPTDKGYICDVKSSWKIDRDPIKMMDLISIEKQNNMTELNYLVRGLCRHYKKGDLLSAYLTMLLPMRTMHLAAFTSFLWNKVVSFRIQKFGLQILPGDFVYVSPTPTPLCGQNDDETWIRKPVKMLTKDDLVQGHPYSIYDVVVPVLGYQVSKYGVPELQDFCEKFLAQYGLPADCFASCELREIEKGYYRHVIVKPQNVDYKIINYDDTINFIKLMPSDLDLLKINESENDTQDEETTKDENSPGCGSPLICAIIQFTLPSSAYATMALREVMLNNHFNPWSSYKWKMREIKNSN